MKVAFPLLVIGFVGIIFFAISRISGWRDFSKRWPARRRKLKSWSMAYTLLFDETTFYNFTVRVSLCDDGVYCDSAFGFPFHHPFLVPWSAVTATRHKNHWWSRVFEIESRTADTFVRIVLPENIEDPRIRKKEPNQTLEPTAPSGRGSS